MIGGLQRFLPPLGVAVILLIASIVIGPVVRLSSGALLGVFVALILLGCVALAVYLAAACERRLAALGTVLVGVSVWIAFYLTPQAAPWLVWTVLFFVGIGLIAYDVGQDTVRRAWWPLAVLRVFFGWAWVDNAQDHFRVGNWFTGDGGQFAQTLNGAAQRPPIWFLDSLYQTFLRGALVPNPDGWAGLTACGELTFGLMIALGVFTPVAVWLSLWQSTNYMLMKGFLSHGGYTDKVFFIADLTVMLTSAGLIYGLDAALQHHVPAWFAKWLLGGTEVQMEPGPGHSPGLVTAQPT
jgi:uncharacterized membrane protein YphA (DoxX/SURF4 family)